MLTICSDPLPRTDLTYAAFRASFHETLERLVLARQFDSDPWQNFGFLTQVPFLKSVPPQVQLDLLSETWHRHVCSETHVASLVDEAVIFAACEAGARMARVNCDEFTEVLEQGPQRLIRGVDDGLAEAMKQLHMALDCEGDFLVISQFEDLPPDEARQLKEELCLEQERLDELFAVLGRWNVTPGFAGRLEGLLSRTEIRRALQVVSD
jgi:hypothetical protein|tara:strand:- start:868 stop:1494 length:627 start_codon:yes stop_codon:yes gene_type:complete